MFGGDIEMGSTSFFDVVGCADDGQVEFQISAYFDGVLFTGICYQFQLLPMPTEYL